MESTTDRRDLLFLSAFGAFVGFKLWSAKSIASFPRSLFFQPQYFQNIAALLPQDTEENFAYAAWDWVGSQIPYEPVGSDMIFTDGQVECDKCFLGIEVLKRGEGNCVAKSSLLASTLLTMVPPERVGIAIGTVSDSLGMMSGHAWCLYQKPDGVWYLLESTTPPKGWITEVESTRYEKHLVMSLTDFWCDDPELCISASGAIKIAISARCPCETLDR